MSIPIPPARTWAGLLVFAVLGRIADTSWAKTGRTVVHEQSRLQTLAMGQFEERIFSAPNAGSPRRGTAEPRALLPWFNSQTGPGCKTPWLMIGAQAWVCGDTVSPSELPSIEAQGQHQLSADGLPFRYHRVGPDGARAYKQLPDVSEGKVAAELEAEFIVGISKIARYEDQDFGLSSKGTWLAMSEVESLSPSSFEGAVVNDDLEKIAWVRSDRISVFDRPAGNRRDSLRRRVRLLALETKMQAGHDWLRLGEQAWVRAQDVRRPSLASPPANLLPKERWIDIELGSQVLTAYQGTTPVFTTLVSTGKGREGTPLATPKGEHRIWVKLRTTDMSNLEDEEAQRYYAIQDVPWVMFFKSGYGLHGAFWHSSFGEVRSHGCVNLAPRDAERLFYWASPRLPVGWSAVLPTPHDVGTRVVIR